MGFRVDDVEVTIKLFTEDGGYRTLNFHYETDKKFGFDLDPVIRLLLDYHHEKLLAAARAAGPDQVSFNF